MNRSSIAVPAQRASSRTARRRRDSRARVLDAATRLFGDRGFAETSMATIARDADVSVGTLYNLFDSKDTLYRQLIRGKAELFRDRLLHVIDHAGSPRAALDAFAEELFALVQEETPALRLYYRINGPARLSFHASLHDEVRDCYETTVEALARAIDGSRPLARAGVSPAAYRAAVCCHAATNALFIVHVDDMAKHPSGRVLAEAKRLMHNAVMPLLADASSPAPTAKGTNS